MRIELKHITPYLPYNLMARNTDASDRKGHEWMGIKPIVGLNGDAVIQQTNSFPYVITFHISKIRPILRPLSDLTKEIEVNGERFVPLEELLKIKYEYYYLNNKHNDIIDRDNTSAWFKYMATLEVKVLFITSDVNTYPEYWIMEKLFEWHFDVFSLIEQGLAIDINTIET